MGGQVKHVIQAVTGPSGVPRLVSEIHKMSAPGGVIEMAEQHETIRQLQSDTIGYGPDELPAIMELKLAMGAKMAAWYQMVTETGELWWVSSDMTDLVCDAASTIPSETVLTPEMAFHREGFVVFERPIIGLGVEAGERVQVDGIMWGPTRLPPLPDRPEGTDCLSMVAFTRISHGFRYHDGEPSGVPFGHELWTPLGRSDWPLGYELSKMPSHESLGDWTVERYESMVEDRALMAALWTVARTTTVADSGQEHPNRPERRRLEREGAVRAHSSVRVIHLRREIPRSGDGALDERAGEPKGKLTHRHIVRAHLRNQACGPGRKDHRLILIPPHIKGPEGAPLLRRPRVWSLDR